MIIKMTLISLAMLLAACQSTSVPQPDLSQTIKVEQHSEPLIQLIKVYLKPSIKQLYTQPLHIIKSIPESI